MTENGKGRKTRMMTHEKERERNVCADKRSRKGKKCCDARHAAREECNGGNTMMRMRMGIPILIPSPPERRSAKCAASKGTQGRTRDALGIEEMWPSVALLVQCV